MKKILIFSFGLILFCISCEKNDTQNTNEKTEIWRPALTSIRDDSSIELTWLNSVIFELNLRPFTYIDPDEFEIFMSKNDPEHLIKIVTLKNDKTYSYKVSNLSNGSNYYFAVKAIKKGKEPLMSDTIMAMPSGSEEILQIINNKDFPMESGSFSKINQGIAYVNRNFTWDNGKYGQMSLFTVNPDSQETSIIDTASYFPDCSPTEMKIVYCSDKYEVSNVNGRPQHIVVYDISSGSIKKLTQGVSFDISPEFSPDGNWIVYSSDEGQPGVFNFWKITKDGTQKSKITQNLNLTSSSIGNIALGRPTWSNDGNLIFFNIVSENKTQNGIYKYDLQNNGIDPIIKSRWIDICPSISPDNDRIAFISNRSGTYQIWTYNFATKSFKQITGSKGDNLNTDWGKLEWITSNKLLYSGFSTTDSEETIFTIELN